MNNLRRSIIALLFSLTVFFNIERLDLQQRNAIDIPSFVYVLGFLAVVVIIGVHRQWRLPIYVWFTGVGAIYLINKLFLFNGRPLIEGIYIYITITEMVFLLINTWLAWRVAQHLYDFEEAVENISFNSSSSRVLPPEIGHSAIQTEVNRGRRYQRPVSLVVIEPEAGSIQAALHRTVREVQQALMSRYVFLALSRVVSEQMRRMDISMEQKHNGRLIIACPETDSKGAQTMVNRIREVAAEKLGLDIKYGIACFPGNALTFEELLSQAEDQLAHPEQQHTQDETTENEPDTEEHDTPAKDIAA